MNTNPSSERWKIWNTMQNQKLILFRKIFIEIEGLFLFTKQIKWSAVNRYSTVGVLLHILSLYASLSLYESSFNPLLTLTVYCAVIYIFLGLPYSNDKLMLEISLIFPWFYFIDFFVISNIFIIRIAITYTIRFITLLIRSTLNILNSIYFMLTGTNPFVDIFTINVGRKLRTWV